jgi:hypothetical protein
MSDQDFNLSSEKDLVVIGIPIGQRLRERRDLPRPAPR